MHIPTLLALAILSTAVNAQQLCNGFAEYCDKPYNSLTYLLTHNSYGFVANPASNQLCPTNVQLDDGVRGLKLSAIRPSNATTTTNSANSIYLCHTSCSILNAGPAVDTLTTISNWVKSNPNEVITIMWNNLGSFEPDDFFAAYNASGILDYTYVQNADNYTWPTLAEMISSGKRVVNFMDEGADPKTYPRLMREWDYVFETPYDNHNETQFSCVIDRPSSINSETGYMYVMNHFLYGTLNLGSTVIEIPQKGTADVTNGDTSLLKQANDCTQTFGRQPNFLEIDFYNRGTALDIAAKLNNVTYTAPGELQCTIYEKNAPDAQGSDTYSSSAQTKRIIYGSTALLSIVATAFAAFL
ncbi:PLC-like phosphodiesterase [Helicostylum pulchrum]|nr:PLC-like phosphodiesterase [Helicostylum pulchrum]